MTAERDVRGAGEDEEADANGGRASGAQPSAGSQGGGISIGHLAGGAVASGEGATAEDRSERVGAPPGPAPGGVATPVPLPPMSPGPGAISVGTMTGGAAAAGRSAKAVDHSRQLISASPELVAAVRLLRAQLPLLAREPADGIDEVDGQLADVEGEIERSGQAERGRLERLRALLTSGSTVAGGLAAAVAVVQAIVQLLG